MSGRDVPFSRGDLGEFRKRYKWMALAVVTAALVLLGRLAQLQVVQGDHYASVARDNVVRKVSLPTARGVIRDAQGRVVATSRPAYNVHLVPGRALPSGRPRYRDEATRETPSVDPWTRIAEVLRLNPEERARTEQRLRQACVTDEDRSPCWRSILVREDVDRDIVAELRQHQSQLPGVELVSAPIRHYPFRNLSAHALGYLAEIDAEALARVRPEGYENMTPEERQEVNPLGYEMGDSLGAVGVERAWESYLRGQRGWEKRIVDARGRGRTGSDAERLLTEPRRQDPIAGRDLRLTLDMELTQAIAKAMRPHLSGAVVVVEVRTGRVLALYSKPDFDPNELSGAGGRSRIREAFARLSTDALRPLLDKTMTGAFHPGSTFKPFSALAALDEGLMDPEETERCDGYLVFGRRIFRCTHVHGKVNMHNALVQSCNIYFHKLAEAVGMDRIARLAGEFGLGTKTGLGINPESAGRIPTRAWYAMRYRGQFRLGFTLNMAIGQGALTVTPLQLALAYAAIANGGTLYSPQIVRAVETSDGAVVQDFPPRVRKVLNVKPEHLARVTEGLIGVVNDGKGTAFPVRDAELDMAGKTGTAQTGYTVKSDDDPKEAWYLAQNHAWFAAFAPSRAPEVAVVVLVEHGGAGPTVAAPVAVEVVREYNRLKTQRAGATAARRGEP
jgi:penicillin-binding protein 2